MWVFREGILAGGGGVEQGDLENCAYLWKNPGYAPAGAKPFKRVKPPKYHVALS